MRVDILPALKEYLSIGFFGRQPHDVMYGSSNRPLGRVNVDYSARVVCAHVKTGNAAEPPALWGQVLILDEVHVPNCRIGRPGLPF